MSTNVHRTYYAGDTTQDVNVIGMHINQSYYCKQAISEYNSTVNPQQ